MPVSFSMHFLGGKPTLLAKMINGGHFLLHLNQMIPGNGNLLLPITSFLLANFQSFKLSYLRKAKRGEIPNFLVISTDS